MRGSWIGAGSPPQPSPSFIEQLAGPSGSSYVGFQQLGAGAVLQSVEGRIRQLPKSAVDFGASANDGAVVDCRPMIIAALNAGRVCYFPEPPSGMHYYVSAPIAAVEGMVMLGDGGEAPIQKTRGSKIYAPNGFIMSSVRTRYELSGLWIVGASTPGIHGIDGPAGGLAEGCLFERFDYLIRNPSGYLQTFRRCKFQQANVGIGINGCNGAHIDDCHFESDVLVQIDNLTLLPGAPIGGGAPFTITNSNFNINTGTQRLAKLVGSIDFRDNYVECFGAVGVGSVLIEYSADRFGFYNLDIQDNMVVGNNNCERALRIYSNNASGTFMHGLVRGNWMRGFTQPPIQIGGGGLSSIVSGIEYRDNEANQAQHVEFSRREANYMQEMAAGYSADSLNISGGTYVVVPLTNLLPNSGADLTAGGGTGWTVGRDGYYDIEVVATLRSAATEQRAVEGQIRVNGVQAARGIASISRGVAAGNWYTCMTITTGPMVLALNDVVSMAFRSGDILSLATIKATRVGDDNYLKV